MPIPKPRKGEDRDKYVSRCVSFIADENPNMPNKQRVAICFSTWRESKGEMPKGISEMLYAFLTHKTVPHFESFEWVPTIEAQLPDGVRIYRFKCIRSGRTYHRDEDGKQYTRTFTDDELHQNGRSLAAARAPINLDHFQKLTGKNYIFDSEFNKEEHDLEALGFVEDRLFHDLYDAGHIVGSSVEYNWRKEVPINGSLKQVGTIFNGLAAVTDRFGDPPASPYTQVTRLLTQYAEVSNHEHQHKVKGKMDVNEKLEAIERRLTEIHTLSKANAVKLNGIEEKFPKPKTADQLKSLAKTLEIPEEKIALMIKVLEDQKPEPPKPEEVRKKARSDNVRRIDALSNTLIGFESARKWLTTNPEVDKIKARLEDLGKERTKLEEQLYPKAPDNEAEIRAKLEQVWAEIYSLESAYARATTKDPTKKGAVKLATQQGIMGSGEDEPEVSENLKAVWEQRKKDAQKFKDDPLSV